MFEHTGQKILILRLVSQKPRLNGVYAETVSFRATHFMSLRGATRRGNLPEG